MSCCDAPGLLALELALELLHTVVTPVDGSETLALEKCLDRVLATDIISPLDIPNYDNSAMDGYGLNVNASDLTQPLTVVGKSLAGHAFTGTVGANECVRIMTGARVPEGCNAVVMQENVTVENDAIVIQPDNRPPREGDNIRYAGNDVKEGSCVLAAGTKLGPLAIGMLASLGLAEVDVRPAIRVGVFSTGDEITPLGQPLKDGFIYDSNRYLVQAALQRMGIAFEDYGVIADNPEAIEATFRKATARCDAIISSGGVSVGEADFTRDILHHLGEITFYKLAMKPGKPFAFGRMLEASNSGRPCYFFGLPGNPVSSAVTFHQLAVPALRRLAGEPPHSPLCLQATTTQPLKKRPGRVDFQRGVLHKRDSNSWQVTPVATQSSGALSSMVVANCYIRLAQDSGNVAAGECVDVLPFDGVIG